MKYDEKVEPINKDQKGLESLFVNILNEIRSCEVTGAALVLGYSNGNTGSAMYLMDDQSPVILLGEIRFLERDLIDCYYETRR